MPVPTVLSRNQSTPVAKESGANMHPLTSLDSIMCCMFLYKYDRSLNLFYIEITDITLTQRNLYISLSLAVDAILVYVSLWPSFCGYACYHSKCSGSAVCIAVKLDKLSSGVLPICRMNPILPNLESRKVHCTSECSCFPLLSSILNSGII